MAPGEQIFDYGSYDFARLDDPGAALGAQTDRVASVRGAVRDQLELYCRLPLVGGSLGSWYADQRGYGVEEPARAGGGRGVQSALQETGDEPYIPLTCFPYGGERELLGVFFSKERNELRERHAPRLADGR